MTAPLGGTSLGLGAAAAIVSLVHGLLPNHWLPFVLIGKAQRWNLRRLLAVMVAAGAAHTAVSGAIAMVTLLVGVAVADRIAEWADVLPGSILVLAGAVYVGLDLLHEARHRGGVAHHHHHHHHHDIHEAAAAGMSDNAAIATLVLSLALSPCEAMVPVFVSAAPTGDPVLLLALVVVSGVCTVAVMAVLGTLAFKGVRRLDFGPFAERERLLMGAILAVMGGITLAATLW